MNENELKTAEDTIYICSVGGSPAPIIKSIDTREPTHIVFIASQDSRKKVEEIRQAITWNGIKDSHIITLANPQDLVACVRDMRNELRDYLRVCDLPQDTLMLADITGGTKVMSSALTLVMMEFRSLFSYVGGTQRTKDGLGTVEDGHEIVLEMSNPWEELGLREARMLAQSFNNTQFATALDRARDLQKRNSTYKDFFTGLATIVGAFQDWDIFNYESAEKNMGTGFGILMAYDNPHHPFFRNLYRELQKAREVLKVICHDSAILAPPKKQKTPELPLPPNVGRMYLIDLVSNARRRAQLGHYDDAVARLYSAVEKTAKIALAQLGKDNSNLTARDLEEAGADFTERYAGMVERDGCAKLGLSESFRYLCAIDRDNPVCAAYRRCEKQLEGVLAVRNQSLLAHGYDPVKQTVFDKLFSIALEFLGLEEKDLVEFPKMDVNALLL